mmetsp:Transcript_36124/g.69277  ORF Transcript_36124/g.69277 Transcript_36124/m.69277 type:complete len:203 (+) Transcript_36124:1240-1848(+)
MFLLNMMSHTDSNSSILLRPHFIRKRPARSSSRNMVTVYQQTNCANKDSSRARATSPTLLEASPSSLSLSLCSSCGVDLSFLLTTSTSPIRFTFAMRSVWHVSLRSSYCFTIDLHCFILVTYSEHRCNTACLARHFCTSSDHLTLARSHISFSRFLCMVASISSGIMDKDELSFSITTPSSSKQYPSKLDASDFRGSRAWAS